MADDVPTLGLDDELRGLLAKVGRHAERTLPGTPTRAQYEALMQSLPTVIGADGARKLGDWWTGIIAGMQDNPNATAQMAARGFGPVARALQGVARGDTDVFGGLLVFFMSIAMAAPETGH